MTVEPRTGLLLFAIFLFVGCEHPGSRGSVTALRSPANLDRERFERLRFEGGFTKQAYVVWSPVWPTANDDITVLYDTGAVLAPFHDPAAITWFLQPETGDILFRRMGMGTDGIAILHERASLLKPGWFAFGQGERRDNDCGNPWKLPIVPSAPDWQEVESKHFLYRWLVGDPVAERVPEVLASLEAHLGVVTTGLGLTVPAERIVFLHYAGRDAGFAYQAHHGNNADEFRHLVFSAEQPDDAHELIHLLVNEQWGRHHAGLFDEGLATHFGQEVAEHIGWQGRSCDAWAREGIEHRDLPPLTSIATASSFYAPPWSPTGGILYYAAGCSFVADLVERYGVGRLRSLLEALSCDNQNNGDTVAKLFQDAFGVSLESADAAWRAKVMVGLATSRRPSP